MKFEPMPSQNLDFSIPCCGQVIRVNRISCEGILDGFYGRRFLRKNPNRGRRGP